MPIVSIIICTRNRAADLRQTLEAVGRVQVPPYLEAEVLVIDNGSTDLTKEVAAEAHLANMPLRYVYEARSGKGYAYNRGLAEARGDIFLLTDDDVRPPVDWIGGMCDPILSGQADAVAGGVAVAQKLQRPWMRAYHRNRCAGTEWMQSESTAPILVGANMAFSRAVQRKVPEFDVELGPGAMGFNDETLFSRQLGEAGFRLVKALHVIVEHEFDSSRLSRACFLEMARKYGRSDAYIFHHWQHERSDHLLWRLVRTKARLMYYRATKGNDCRGPEGLVEWEFDMVQEVAFLEQLRKEVKLPRKYDRRGLVKLGSARNGPQTPRVDLSMCATDIRERSDA